MARWEEGHTMDSKVRTIARYTQEKDGLPWHEILVFIRDEDATDVQAQASLVRVVVVQEARRCSWGHKEERSELNVALCLEVGVGHGRVGALQPCTHSNSMQPCPVATGSLVPSIRSALITGRSP